MLHRCEFSVGSAAEAATGNVMTHTDSALCVAGIDCHPTDSELGGG